MTDREQRMPVHCPGCGSYALKDRPCGCREFNCGGTLTCSDYHHGDGTLLDCPKEDT